ncbi:MAG: DEAD/DEAH box helicase [SAR324 cluster bacterium]|nr:DEAD/DEAH box helicase [SAR324 cluster bacterium]
MANMIGSTELRFKEGKLLLTSEGESIKNNLNTLSGNINLVKSGDHFITDALHYRRIYRYLYKNTTNFKDKAKNYQELSLTGKEYKLYDYQQKSLDCWHKSKWGIIVLPTGAGKTVVATKAISYLKRSTLVLVPTIVLLKQWQGYLEKIFATKIGSLGGGNKDLADITVSTYDSAAIYAKEIGDRFCFLIFDEVHNAASWGNYRMGQKFIAPYRLGLTATMPEEQDRLDNLTKIVGPILFTLDVDSLTGSYLAGYDIQIIEVDLSITEQVDYDKHRNIYQNYRKKTGFASSWRTFAIRAYQSKEGKLAMESFNIQKKIALNAEEKFTKLSEILDYHKKGKVLIFTNDNDSANMISEKFSIDIITHKTKAKERKEILSSFREGKNSKIVSSRVLNEGIDVPDVAVAVIFSGTSTTREHRQRLGRILRKVENKKATLYELITRNTAEVFTSQKRNNNLGFNSSKII